MANSTPPPLGYYWAESYDYPYYPPESYNPYDMAPTRASSHAASAIDPRLSNDSPSVDTDDHNLHAALTHSLYPNDNQFAGLVEAAAAAAGQGAEWAQGENEAILTHHGHGQLPPRMGSYATPIDGIPMDMPHLNGNGSESQYPVEGLQEHITRKPNTRKRKRVSSLEQNANSDIDLAIRDHPPQQALAAARAAGVQSAAALFRQPSNTSKKYTRPPMVTLFESLHITPERFVQLQATAKKYMLDDSYPDRRNCVGQKGKDDGEFVKLKLWQCVEGFLAHDNIGEQYFGASVPHVNPAEGPRPWVWPSDREKVIKAVTPLCRRMVTNERQKDYATRVRKGGPKEDKIQGGIEQDEFQFQDAHVATTYKAHSKPATMSTAANSSTSHVGALLTLQIVVLRNGRRSVPRLDLPSEALPDLSTLRLKINDHLLDHGKPDLGGHFMDVKIHLAGGLVKVEDDREWTASLSSAAEVEWMDGEAKVVIDVEE